MSGYLSGVFDGDGSYTTVKNNKYPKTINHRILFSTSSKEFAKDIQNILREKCTYKSADLSLS